MQVFSLRLLFAFFVGYFLLTSGCKKRSEMSSQPLDLTNMLPTTVQGIDIPGTHSLENDASGKARVLRGMTPKTKEHLKQLKNYGVENILIFKNETRDEVKKEQEDLESQGFDPNNIFHIPFRYKDFEDFNYPCHQTMDALKIIKTAAEENRIYFHCTVGEDRTGLLAGIYRMLHGTSAEDAFLKEMCARGYGSGNPRKPDKVVQDVQNNLTPLFIKYAYLIANQKITWENLDQNACDIGPDAWTPYRESLSIELECPLISSNHYQNTQSISNIKTEGFGGQISQ